MLACSDSLLKDLGSVSRLSYTLATGSPGVNPGNGGGGSSRPSLELKGGESSSNSDCATRWGFFSATLSSSFTC